MKVLSIAILLWTTASYAEITGKQIAEKAMSLPGGNTMTAKVQMEINRKGKTLKRDLELLRYNDRSILRVCSPKKVRGTSLLSIASTKEGNIFWLRTPSSKKAKKISVNLKNKSFISSDYNYEDLTKLSIKENNFKKLDDEKRHYVLKVTPINKKSPYAYKKAWIRKDNFVVQKIEFYDKKEKLIKKSITTVVQRIKGYWTATERKILNTKTGGMTQLNFTNIKYNTKLDSSLFKEDKLNQKCSLK